MEKKTITFDTFVRGITGIVIVVLLYFLLRRLSGVLTPFFVAWLIAYLIFPLVKFFQYKLRFKYRILAIISALIVVAGVLVGLFYLVVPPFIVGIAKVKDLVVAYAQNSEVLSNLPYVVQDFIEKNINADKLKELVTQQGFIDGVKAAAPKLWGFITHSIGLVSGVLSLTMIALYILFILLEYENMSQGWPNLLPEKYRGFAVQLVNDIESGMNKYFRGQAVVALLVGILFSIGFLIIGFPMAVGLGLFIGLLNMVPYMQILGFIPTILLAIVKSAETGENFWLIMLMALIVFAVVQTIQDTVLTPKIMGKVTGLNSAIILLSLSIWGSLLGVMGMIIALPMTTLLLSYYQRFVVQPSNVGLRTASGGPVLEPNVIPDPVEGPQEPSLRENCPAEEEEVEDKQDSDTHKSTEE